MVHDSIDFIILIHTYIVHTIIHIYICIPILSTIVVCIFSKVIKLKEPMIDKSQVHVHLCPPKLGNIGHDYCYSPGKEKNHIPPNGKRNNILVSLQPYRGIPSTL